MSRALPCECASNVSRRAFLRYLNCSVLAGATCGLSVGCQRSGLASLNFWGTGTLDIVDWTRFQADNQISVQFEDNQNDPGPIVFKLIEQRESALRHISGLQGGAEAELSAKGAIIPWDLSKIPHFKGMWPFAKKAPYALVNGEQYGIPAVVNADSMIYLPDKVGTVTSYAAVFDPDFRGHTSMEDAWINSVIFTAIYLKENNKAKISEPGNLTESELKEVMRFLSEHARAGQFRKLWSGWKDGVELITSGDVWVMTGWEPIAYEAQRQNAQVKVSYAVPKEGYEGWSNDLLLHPGSKAAGTYEMAHRFVDWELSGYYGCQLAAMRGYVVPTDDAVAYAQLHPAEFDPQRIKSIVENVKHKFLAMKGAVYWQNVRPDNYALYEEQWAKFRALM